MVGSNRSDLLILFSTLRRRCGDLPVILLCATLNIALAATRSCPRPCETQPNFRGLGGRLDLFPCSPEISNLGWVRLQESRLFSRATFSDSISVTSCKARCSQPRLCITYVPTGCRSFGQLHLNRSARKSRSVLPGQTDHSSTQRDYSAIISTLGFFPWRIINFTSAR